ncbi:hypothetical protein TNCV_2056731 [Trichonephila clavipes]|nr:hypothetical protein TNCV_2056731 [Trichonephila clavipes]
MQKVQDMRRMQPGTQTSLQMVYEAFLRAGADVRPPVGLAERLPERILTPPAEPETPPLEMMDPPLFL